MGCAPRSGSAKTFSRRSSIPKRDRRERRSPAAYVTRRDVALLVALLTLLDSLAKLVVELLAFPVPASPMARCERMFDSSGGARKMPSGGHWEELSLRSAAAATIIPPPPRSAAFGQRPAVDQPVSYHGSTRTEPT